MYIYKTIYRPSFTFECESWRRIKEIIKQHQIKSDDIERKFIYKIQIRWWGHLQRMKNSRQVNHWVVPYVKGPAV